MVVYILLRVNVLDQSFRLSQVIAIKKGEVFSSIAHYQKPYSIGKTDQQQRWKDAVSCGSKYGDQELYYINKTGKYEEFQSCMERKDIKDFGPQNAVIKIPKWDKGICNE